MAQTGYLDGEQMSGAFQMLRTNDLLWSRMLNEYLLGERRPMNDLMAWNADLTRMPERMHSEYLRKLFLKDELSEGRYMVGDRPVALSDVSVPIFSVATVSDHVAPCDRCTNCITSRRPKSTSCSPMAATTPAS